MLNYQLPERQIEIRHLVLDFNGTIACDGNLLPGVVERLQVLAEKVKIYVLTADTFGTAASICPDLPVELIVVDKQAGGSDKERLVEKLGAKHTAAIGNGVNDGQMLARAGLGLVVIGPEGAAVDSLKYADVVFTDIIAALDFLLKPQRLVATLRP